jgi:hypothetical protein
VFILQNCYSDEDAAWKVSVYEADRIVEENDDSSMGGSSWWMVSDVVVADRSRQCKVYQLESVDPDLRINDFGNRNISQVSQFRRDHSELVVVASQLDDARFKYLSRSNINRG